MIGIAMVILTAVVANKANKANMVKVSRAARAMSDFERTTTSHQGRSASIHRSPYDADARYRYSAKRGTG